MKHAVIFAHPKPDSFTAAVAETYAEAARALGHEAVVRDLYRMGFDPCLKAEEIPTAEGYKVAADVAAERALLDDADVFAFVYPFWFNAPPAILKGYVDRVFGMGFGFEPAAGGTQALLDGRKMISFSSSGAPEDWVRETGAMAALHTLFDNHLAGVCGLTVVDHIHVGGIVPGLTPEWMSQILENVRGTVRRCFAEAESALT
ncbi:NAD(P)H-dependent oxidoreductase [Phenylobacterium sp.]|uniref:NAD(P)H-dependent oxidoreductase n=1 Tax=Phenylobacterium sp. TaxID=1871053 RepID=UPI002BE001DC|nr:NAD(P)H-dependent oxidoreductase [Phenylobacterium sp.]HVI33543.1 NAD(P)H-dependent oxidoreductase [Phenylobacterium sp.]